MNERDFEWRIPAKWNRNKPNWMWVILKENPQSISILSQSLYSTIRFQYSHSPARPLHRRYIINNGFFLSLSFSMVMVSNVFFLLLQGRLMYFRIQPLWWVAFAVKKTFLQCPIKEFSAHQLTIHNELTNVLKNKWKQKTSITKSPLHIFAFNCWRNELFI